LFGFLKIKRYVIIAFYQMWTPPKNIKKKVYKFISEHFFKPQNNGDKLTLLYLLSRFL
jgi:hypothetical protein